MSASTARYDILRIRADRFTRMLHRLNKGDCAALDGAWAATRRLRELMPVLQVEPAAVRKLAARLRKLGRRLASARELRAALTVLDQLIATDRRGRHAVARVRQEMQTLAEDACAGFVRKRAAHETERLRAKLDALLSRVSRPPAAKFGIRDLRWAVSARVARRALGVKDAVNAAGSVYLAERLQHLRVALIKLRFGAELGLDVSVSVTATDLRTVQGLERVLGRLHHMQLLIDRIRGVQGRLATPDLKAWRDLDDLVDAVETRCRALHARYVRDREGLVALCDGLIARAPLTGAKRKAS
jgi:hypothetical protein